MWRESKETMTVGARFGVVLAMTAMLPGCSSGPQTSTPPASVSATAKPTKAAITPVPGKRNEKSRKRRRSRTPRVDGPEILQPKTPGLTPYADLTSEAERFTWKLERQPLAGFQGEESSHAKYRFNGYWASEPSLGYHHHWWFNRDGSYVWKMHPAGKPVEMSRRGTWRRTGEDEIEFTWDKPERWFAIRYQFRDADRLVMWQRPPDDDYPEQGTMYFRQ